MGKSIIDPALIQELDGIPDKMAFKIGEVAHLLKVKPYVLRYWETEFKMLKPQKSKQNQRIYLQKDVALLFMIKKLLYKDRFSIEGARLALERRPKKAPEKTWGTLGQVEELKRKAQSLLVEIQQLRSLFT